MSDLNDTFTLPRKIMMAQEGESGALNQQKHNSLAEEHANIIVNILLIITIGNLQPLETQY